MLEICIALLLVLLQKEIRTRLQRIGHSFPQVTGMNWRLDYTFVLLCPFQLTHRSFRHAVVTMYRLRSSSGGKVMLPTYVISLKTLDGAGEEKEVQFT